MGALLSGSQIVLRPYTLADGHDIHRWKNDPQTTLWMGRRFRQASSLLGTQESLARAMTDPSDSSLFYAIAEKENLHYLGGIDLTDIDWIDKNAVLSLVVADPTRRRQGYASEAIGLLLGHAFGTMKLHKVSLNVYEDNVAAFQCYLKHGFRVEGRIRDYQIVEGKYRDRIAMGILESEYKEGPG